jgi:Iron-sulphur cluster biosynthesis
VPKAEPEDAVIEHADAKILVDSLSLVYLAGSEIDYVDDLISASFKIKNPNATAACGLRHKLLGLKPSRHGSARVLDSRANGNKMTLDTIRSDFEFLVDWEDR